MKKAYIFILLFITSLMCSQNDSLRHPNMNHFLGVDFGYTSYNYMVGNKGSTNLNYVLNPYYLCVKVQVGIAPGTNFGTLTKGFISIGFSTLSNKFLSWHLLTGLGFIKPSKSYSVIEYNNKNSHTTTNTFASHPFFIETGFYIKPSKKQRIIIGLNSVLHRVSIDDGSGIYSPYFNNDVINLNLSINLKLNK